MNENSADILRVKHLLEVSPSVAQNTLCASVLLYFSNREKKIH